MLHPTSAITMQDHFVQQAINKQSTSNQQALNKQSTSNQQAINKQSTHTCASASGICSKGQGDLWDALFSASYHPFSTVAMQFLQCRCCIGCYAAHCVIAAWQITQREAKPDVEKIFPQPGRCVRCELFQFACLPLWVGNALFATLGRQCPSPLCLSWQTGGCVMEQMLGCLCVCAE